jgi:hypothetical protein
VAGVAGVVPVIRMTLRLNPLDFTGKRPLALAA